MSNTVINISEEYKRAKERAKGVTAENKNVSTVPFVSTARKKASQYITPASGVTPQSAEPKSTLSGKTGYATLDQVQGGKAILDLKKEYESGKNPQNNMSLTKAADGIRKEYGLSDEQFGAGVTSKDVVNHLRKMEGSPEYQRDLAYKTYGDTNKKLSGELTNELTNEVKMRAVLDRAKAEKMAEEQVGAQLDKEIQDSLNYEDEMAAQRGSYNQMSYGKRRALKEESLRDNRAARIRNLVDSILSEDRAKAEAEYQQNVAAKENRIKAIGQKMQQNESDFRLGQQYRGEIAQEAAAQQQAIYESVKAQYEQAFDMTNALGYVTPELSALTGIETGTPLFKLTEYYGDMQKFYDQLELEAQRVAIEQYNATKPRYSYGGYNGYNGNNNSSGDGTLTWNQAKAALDKFTDNFSKERAKVNQEYSNITADGKPMNLPTTPTAADLITWLNSSGYSDEDKNQILLAAGYTPNDVRETMPYVRGRDADGSTIMR